jgi:hypothetical protein
MYVRVCVHEYVASVSCSSIEDYGQGEGKNCDTFFI